jgi:MFS family permease
MRRLCQRPARVSDARYLHFLLATGSWFLAWGLQSVVLPWLVVETLRESPARVGLAQGLALLPALPLLLLGGAVADRVEPRRLLLALHGALALLFAGLALLVERGGLSYSRLLLFALGAGALNALQSPARDTQLYPIARDAISRGVAGANLVTQAGQAAGGLAGAALSGLGAPFVLGVQALLALAGTLPVALLGRTREAGRTPPPPRRPLAGVGAALGVAARSEILRPVLLLTVCVGLLFVGPYGVVLPLLVRDVYGGGPREIGVLVSVLPLGGIVAGLAIFARGGIRRNGRALLVGQGFAALCIGALAAAPPFAGAVALVLGWGVGSAFFLSAGRTLFHLAAPEAQRGTLLGLYALGILGAGPLGSLLSGALVGWLGPHATLALQAAAMLAFVGVAAFWGDIAAV